MFYDKIYIWLYEFAQISLFGVSICKPLAFVTLIVLLWASRIISSMSLKVAAVVMSMIIYFFPEIVGIFLN